jgi:phosphatidylserine/phosphatidylglycerophosphate/cardiolipin synthase-like enzyme
MQNITQPFINLATANAALITRFAQSPEMAELAKTSAQKYFELAQKSFGHAAASNAYADLVRRLTENYSTFTHEYSQSLMGIAAKGQSVMAEHIEAASNRLTKTGKTAVAAVAKASDKAKRSRTRKTSALLS